MLLSIRFQQIVNIHIIPSEHFKYIEQIDAFIFTIIHALIYYY